MKYEVRFEVEVEARSPELAVRLALAAVTDQTVRKTAVVSSGGDEDDDMYYSSQELYVGGIESRGY